MFLNHEGKIELLGIARRTLEAYLKRGEFMTLEPSNPSLREKGGAFVTLEKAGELRGCIGRLAADRPIFLTVQQMAVEAATGDPRFPRVTAAELEDIVIEISALSALDLLPLERVAEIETGKHGLVITLGRNRGLLLPQVAVRKGWDRETFLSATCLKAGLPPEAWKNGETRIEIFTAEVFSEKDFAK